LYFVQALEAKFAQMLSTQNEQHHKEMEQLKDEFAMKLAEQQKQMMAQFQVPYLANHSLFSGKNIRKNRNIHCEFGKKHKYGLWSRAGL
jgi:hypothetical protein